MLRKERMWGWYRLLCERPSICLHIATQEPLNGFWLNLTHNWRILKNEVKHFLQSMKTKWRTDWQGSVRVMAVTLVPQLKWSDLLKPNITIQRLRSCRGSVLPLSTQVRGFKSGQSHQDFSGRKNPQHAFLQKGSKAVDPMSQICGM